MAQSMLVKLFLSRQKGEEENATDSNTSTLRRCRKEAVAKKTVEIENRSEK